MNPNPSSGQTSRNVSALAPTQPGTSAESTFGDSASESVDQDRLNQDVNKLRRDVASVKDALARLAAQKGDEVAKTFRNVSQTVTSHVGSAASGVADAGSELASSAKDQAKTFAAELENMTRRNPWGALAGAVLVGVIMGIIARGRS